MSDEDLARLRREARALGLDPRAVAAELLGTSPSRFLALTSEPWRPTSKRAGFRINYGEGDYPRDLEAWTTPIERLEDLAELAAWKPGDPSPPPRAPFQSFAAVYDTEKRAIVFELAHRDTPGSLVEAPPEGAPNLWGQGYPGA
jgi:hypothetical protein